jgi:hypothetical protein
MSAGVVAFLAAISISVWAFTKLQQRAGYGNDKAAIKGAAVVFVAVFVVVFTLGHMIIK